MFDGMEALARRLLAAAPTSDDLDSLILTLDDGGVLVDELQQNARLIAAAEARNMMIMAAMCDWAEAWQARQECWFEQQVGPGDLVATEIAPALRMAPRTAASRVHEAQRIVTELPATLAALARGDIDKARAFVIDRATAVLDPQLAGKVERQLLPKAVDQTPGELRAAAEKAVIAANPTAAERRRKLAMRDRAVQSWTREDGLAAINVTLSAIDAGEVYDVIDQVARQSKTTEDTRSADARRSDAFVRLVLGRDPNLGPGDDDPPLPPEPPLPGRWSQAPPDPADDDVRPENPAPEPPAPADMDEPDDLDERFPPEPHDQARVTLTRAERIAELAARACSDVTQRRPARTPIVTIHHVKRPDGREVAVGELQGYGAITAECAQHLLDTDAAKRPDPPSGREPTDEEANEHDPPAWLARDIRARDGTCRFAGCRQPIQRSDLDHTVPFPRGLTVRTNLGGLCRRHHRTKQSGWWRVGQDEHGTYTWTSTRTGRSYQTHPRGTTGDWHGATRVA